MLHDEAFHDRIEAAVGAAEEKTSAEIVVVLAHASGIYRDADFLFGAAVAALTLAVVLFAPFRFHEVQALLYTVAAFAVGAAFSARTGAIRRRLTTEHRRRLQTHAAASFAFLEEGVAATAARNGILIYVSDLERAVEVLPDLAIDGKVPRSVWNELRHAIENAGDEAAVREALVAAVGRCGAVLAGPFPPGAKNPDEIPNRPRVRT